MWPVTTRDPSGVTCPIPSVTAPVTRSTSPSAVSLAACSLKTLELKSKSLKIPFPFIFYYFDWCTFFFSADGPENLSVTLNPPQEYHATGSNISLSCSAVSRPAAQYYWFLNGDRLPGADPELRLIHVQESQSGNYSCQAFNNKTLRSQIAQAPAVTVMGELEWTFLHWCDTLNKMVFKCQLVCVKGLWGPQAKGTLLNQPPPRHTCI